VERYHEEYGKDYSSERFYLLSQIQHTGSDLVFSSATKEEGCVTGYQEEFCTVSSEQSASIVVIYILLVMKEVLFDDMDHQKVWTKRVVEQLAAKVKALANHKGASGANVERFLEVDLVAPPPASFSGAQQLARQILAKVDQCCPPAARAGTTGAVLNATKSKDEEGAVHGGGTAPTATKDITLSGRAVSVSDDPTCCPGLERVACRFAEALHASPHASQSRLPPENSKNHSSSNSNRSSNRSSSPRVLLRVLVESRGELLGADPDAEPDAKQGVKQWTAGDLHPCKRSALLRPPRGNCTQTAAAAKADVAAVGGILRENGKGGGGGSGGAGVGKGGGRTAVDLGDPAFTTKVLALASGAARGFVNFLGMAAFFAALWPQLPGEFRLWFSAAFLWPVARAVGMRQGS